MACEKERQVGSMQPDGVWLALGFDGCLCVYFAEGNACYDNHSVIHVFLRVVPGFWGCGDLRVGRPTCDLLQHQHAAARHVPSTQELALL